MKHDTGIISRGSNRFRRGNFKTVERQGGTRAEGLTNVRERAWRVANTR